MVVNADERTTKGQYLAEGDKERGVDFAHRRSE